INDDQSGGGGKHDRMHPADVNALSARLRWLPAFPQFTENSIDMVANSRNNGATTDQEFIDDIVQQIKDEKVEWAIENPDEPRNFPRVFFNWRSNLDRKSVVYVKSVDVVGRRIDTRVHESDWCNDM